MTESTNTRIETADSDSAYIVTMYENGSETPTKIVITQKASGKVVIVDCPKETVIQSETRPSDAQAYVDSQLSQDRAWN